MSSTSCFLVRYRFVFYRFRPTVWWWGSVIIARQLLLAFSLLVFPDDPYAQIVYIVTVLVLYISAAACAWPWKCSELNIVEIGTLGCLTLFIVVAGAFAPRTDNSS